MPGHRFPQTSWSLIAQVGAPHTPQGHAALALLCEAYWFPVYAFIRRRAGSPERARDRTQGFFARLLEKNDLAKVDRAQGKRFRSWLLACVQHYLANEHDREHAQKRGGGRPLESLDAAAAEGRYTAEPSHDLTPERLYSRHFALSLLARVLEQLRAEYASAGNEARFDALKGCLSQDAEQRPHEELAAPLGMTVGAVKKAAYDLRARYRKLLRAEVGRLVDQPDDEAAVNEELRHLLAALAD
jgi:RNA polymerase sigma-70 factor (ECF subfamily)